MEVDSGALNSGSNPGLRRDAESMCSDATPLFVEPPWGPTQPPPGPLTVWTGQTSGGSPQARQDEETGKVTIFPRSLIPKGSGPNRKGIAAGIAIVSHNAASLLPDTTETFPETKLEKEKQESWMRRHIVKPVKKMVRMTPL